MYKKMGIIALLIAGLFIASFTSVESTQKTEGKPSSRERKISKEVIRQIIAFRDYVKDSLLPAAQLKNIDVDRVRNSFKTSRLLFKKFEWAAEYFSADLTMRLNGPPVQEIENADLLDPTFARGVDPVGLQVIEEYIYPEFDTTAKKKLVTQIGYLLTNTDYLIDYMSDHELADWRILDAAKLEVFRIITLGITGFDNPLSLNSMEEAAVSLASLKDVLHFYKNRSAESLLRTLDSSILYLDMHSDFNAFDRAEFITDFANRISTDIAILERGLPGRKIKYNRMLKQGANTLFDSGAFNADAFSPGPEFHMTPDKVQLGKRLFYDAALSGNGKRSCATCHQPDLSFTDGLAKNEDIHHPKELLARNVPTLLNAALQSNFFYDMRALTLEDQVRDVISNKREMDGSMDSVVAYVSGDKLYPSLFAKAFNIKSGESIHSDQVANALASYIRSLIRLNSRFDQYMRGNENALSKQELNGFNLFMGKAKCATCHFAPLFNGVTPPKYVESETEVLGVPTSLSDSTLDPDLGYYDVIGVDSYKHAFKVPTVRNIKKTAPYMHNGVYQTLQQVMEFYNNGGGAGLGLHLSNQTLPTDSLGLSATEQADVIAFMESLEG